MKITLKKNYGELLEISFGVGFYAKDKVQHNCGG